MPFCSKCGTKLDETEKFCPKCGMAVYSATPRSERKELRKAKRKPMSMMTIILIIIVVAVVIVGLLSTLFLLGGWKPLGEVVGSGSLGTKEEFYSDFTSVDAGSGFMVEISKSNSHSVLITADDNVMEYIETNRR